MISLSELLVARGFTPVPKQTKLVRHKDDRYDVEALHIEGWLETYQMFQAKPVFEGCRQIIVFIGESRLASRFVGVYDVGQGLPSEKAPRAAGCPYPEWFRDGQVFYALEKRAGFEDLEDRLIIDWGKGALAWHQWFTDRAVIEVRPPGRALPPFRDYLRVHLKHDDLRRLAAQPTAHPDWVSALSAVGGIYLIVDGVSGQQYVGSATGNGGLWQRWCEYAKTGHGGNLRLRTLCQNGDVYPKALSFSILETFSRSLALSEAVSLEGFFKKKLGSRAFGLNAN